MPGHKGRMVISGASLDACVSVPSDRNKTEEGMDWERVMKYDITEIDGADYLSAPSGIIAESEANAGKLFGCSTFYSTEGSSLCIRAMMFLVKKYAKQKGHEPFILAGRNAHASFVNACAVLDIDVEWIMQRECDSYESCGITGEELDTILCNLSDNQYGNESAENRNREDFSCTGNNDSNRKAYLGRLPDAVYVTSPDYLGNMLDIKELAEVCHKHGILLLVDNAHGAYLKFLETSLHPMDLGADMCCDSAHKTLPVLTGGAYLHIASFEGPRPKISELDIVKDVEFSDVSFFVKSARQALAIFATTSPSYLILQSLDQCNVYLEDNGIIRETAVKVKALKEKLTDAGYHLIGNEPLKVTFLFKYFEDSAKKSENNEVTVLDSLAGKMTEYLKSSDIYVEYHDDEHMVLMFSGNTTDEDFKKTETALLSFPGIMGETGYPMENIYRSPRNLKPGNGNKTDRDNKTLYEELQDQETDISQRKKPPIKAMSFMEAMLAQPEKVNIKKSIGRILAQPVLNCPPCVPVYMCGEVIGEDILKIYSADSEISVVKS